MTTAAPPRRVSFFARLTLRSRLVIAFLSVSVIPVMLASFVAAEVISTMFEQNLEHWLEDAARFVARQSDDDRAEADRAATIVAAALGSAAGNLDANASDVADLDTGAIALSADLLASLGYDLVVIYSQSGEIAYRRGRFTELGWLPRREVSGFFPVKDKGSVSLLVGATHRFNKNGQAYYVLVADEWDGSYMDVSGAIPSLQVASVAMADGGVLHFKPGVELRIPADVERRLKSGAETMTARLRPEDPLSTGFAALRDASGGLVGVVVCSLSSELSYLSHIRTWQLFGLLCICSCLVSLAVALLLAKLISEPLRALTRSLRFVRDGDYKARLPVVGGRELAELAAGFNSMTAELDDLHERELALRRREQLAVLGEAAAAIAHEIRNPLGIIKTSSQVLRMKARLPAESDRLIGFVLEEVGRIDQLVRDLLDYVRPHEPEKRRIDLRHEVGRVLEFAEPELARRGITLVFAPPVAGEGSTVIDGDGSQLYQAFLNILLNAMDAMPDGGTLSVKVMREGGEVVVSIRDSGTGIAPDVRPRIFEPFVTNKPRGTGLGLAKVRNVVDLHGGTLLCESELGRGTVFALSFPAADP